MIDDLELYGVVIGAPDAPCDDGYGAAVYALLESHQRVQTKGAEYHVATRDRKAAMKALQRFDVNNKRIAAMIRVQAGAVWKAKSEHKKKKRARGNGEQEG